MHIQCDEELISQFDPAKTMRKLIAQDGYSGIFGSWHATLINALGSQFLLTVHTKSLYSAIEWIDSLESPLIVQAADNLHGKILAMLSDYFNLTDHQEKMIAQPFKNISFGPVSDKRMAKISNGIVLAYQKRFAQARRDSVGGEIRLWELEDDLNNLPRRNLGGITPAETLRQLIWSGVN